MDRFPAIAAAALEGLEPMILERHVCAGRDPGTGRQVIVARWLDGEDDRVEAWLDHLLGRWPPGRDLAVAVIGGSARGAARLERASEAHRRPRLHLIHVADDGTVKRIRRARWTAGLDGIVDRLDTLPPLDDDALHDRMRERVREAQRKLGDERRFVGVMQARRPVVVVVVLIGIGLVSGLQLALGTRPWVDVRLGALVGHAVRAGELWRTLSCTFLHGGFVHLALNGIGLWVLGSLLERLLGAPRFAVLYVASGIGAGLTSATLAADRTSVGASGAIYGLLGAGAVLAFRPGGLLPPSVVPRARSAVVSLFVVNAAVTLLPGIDGWAHAGGAATGALVLLLGRRLLGLGPVASGPAPPAGKGVQLLGAAALAVLGGAEAVALSQADLLHIWPPERLELRQVGPMQLNLPRWSEPIRGSDPDAYVIRAGRLVSDPAAIYVRFSPAPAGREIIDPRRELELLTPALDELPPGTRRISVEDGPERRGWTLRTVRLRDERGFRRDRTLGVGEVGFAFVEVGYLPADRERWEETSAAILGSITWTSSVAPPP